MKNSDLFLLIIGMSVIIILTIILNHKDQERQHEEIIQRFNRVDSIIAKRNHIDTLYWIHLEQCAFKQVPWAPPDTKN